MFAIVPDYTTFGSQHYVANVTVGNSTNQVTIILFGPVFWTHFLFRYPNKPVIRIRRPDNETSKLVCFVNQLNFFRYM